MLQALSSLLSVSVSSRIRKSLRVQLKSLNKRKCLHLIALYAKNQFIQYYLHSIHWQLLSCSILLSIAFVLFALQLYILYTVYNEWQCILLPIGFNLMMWWKTCINKLHVLSFCLFWLTNRCRLPLSTALSSNWTWPRLQFTLWLTKVSQVLEVDRLQCIQYSLACMVLHASSRSNSFTGFL